MKKTYFLAAIGVGALALAGCADTLQNNAAARGGLLGAAAGALVGAAIGGATGAVVGASTVRSERYRPRRRCVRVGYDYDGNRICRQYVYD